MTPDLLATIHSAAFVGSRGWSAHEFAELLISPFCFLVGNENSFAIGRVIADEAELLTIATPPTVQRSGFGRQCLSEFHREAAARGAVSAFLEVAEDNIAAMSLYESAGWLQTAVRKGYYARTGGIRVDARILTCNLT